MWGHRVYLKCACICLFIAKIALVVPISAIEVPLKETSLYTERNMEPTTLFTVDTSSSVLDMVLNATEKAAVLLPIAQNLIFDTVLTNYTQSMCNELASLDSIHDNVSAASVGVMLQRDIGGRVSSPLDGNRSSHRATAALDNGGAAKFWCSPIWDGISCWPPTPSGSVVAKSCHLLLRAIDDSIPPDISHSTDATTQAAAQHDVTQHHLSQQHNPGLAELYAFRTCGPDGVWVDNITNYNACIAFLTQYHATPAPPVSVMPLAVTCILVSFSAVSLAFLVAAAAIFIHFSSLSCPRTRVHLNLVWALTLHSLCMIIISLPVVINAAAASHNSHQQEQQQQQQHQQAAAATPTATTTTTTTTNHLQQPSLQHHSESTSSSPQSPPPHHHHQQQQQQPDGAQLAHGVNTNPVEADHQGSTSRVIIPNIISVPSLCKVTLCAKMYSSMSSINWMFIEGLLLHSRLTTSIFRKDAPFPLYYAIGWGLPIVFIIPWGVRMELELPGKSCWEGYGNHSWVFLLIAPRLIVLIINLGFLINIVRILVTKSKNNSAESTQARKAIKATLLLFPLLGITHLLFCINPHENDVALKNTYMIVNAFLQSSQGIFVSVIHCFMNSEVQAQLRNAYLRAAIRRNPNRKSVYSGSRHVTSTFSQRRRTTSSTSREHSARRVAPATCGGGAPGKLFDESPVPSPLLENVFVV